MLFFKCWNRIQKLCLIQVYIQTRSQVLCSTIMDNRVVKKKYGNGPWFHYLGKFKDMISTLHSGGENNSYKLLVHTTWMIDFNRICANNNSYNYLKSWIHNMALFVVTWKAKASARKEGEIHHVGTIKYHQKMVREVSP